MQRVLMGVPVEVVRVPDSGEGGTMGARLVEGVQANARQFLGLPNPSNVL